MSLETVKSVIEKFVQNKRSDLLTIKGNWGVGKTYFWQNTVAELSRKSQIAHKNYSYVSLFGVNTLESLKSSLMASQIASNAISKDSFTSGSVLISKLKGVATFIEKNPKVRAWTDGWANELAYQIVNDSLICFDDIERKSESINLKDILGLASFLKEQRNCKIVFILNQGTLTEKDAEEFQKYNEKVVDIELEFNPTSEETFEYIFDKSHQYFELIKSSCTILKIKNIRILQRIKRFIEELLPFLINLEEIVCKQIISSIILFVWFYYDKDKETLPFESLENFSPVSLYIKKTYNNEEPTEAEQEMYKLLSDYGYSRTDELAKELISFVKKGFLEDSFLEELKKKNDEAIAQKGKASYSDVWKLHRTSLDLDENEFIEKLVSAFRLQEKYLSYSNLFEVVNLLRRYERNTLANELIDEFLPKKIDHKTLSIMKRIPGYSEYLKDEYFSKKLNKIKKPTEAFTFAEVMEALFQYKYLEEDMLVFLASASIDDYYNYLKSDEVGEFYFPSKLLLEYGTHGTDKHKSILDKTRETLMKIASESRINKNRISDWLDINIDG